MLACGGNALVQHICTLQALGRRSQAWGQPSRLLKGCPSLPILQFLQKTAFSLIKGMLALGSPDCSSPCQKWPNTQENVWKRLLPREKEGGAHGVHIVV